MDYFAHTTNAGSLLDRLAAAEPTTLACMHGSAEQGDTVGDTFGKLGTVQKHHAPDHRHARRHRRSLLPPPRRRCAADAAVAGGHHGPFAPDTARQVTQETDLWTVCAADGRFFKFPDAVITGG
jgi:hypothetical protein